MYRSEKLQWIKCGPWVKITRMSSALYTAEFSMAILKDSFNEHVFLETLACTLLVVAMQYISRSHFTNCAPGFTTKTSQQ
jgi:hypothetical protein